MRKIVCLLFVLLAGCATAQKVDDHLSLEFVSTPTIYIDQWVKKSNVELYVKPREQAAYMPKVLFMPFRVTQKMENAEMLGYGVSRAIYQSWLEMQVFQTMEFSGEGLPFRRDLAIQFARSKGADVVFGGFITYIYPGGTVGSTQLAIQIEGIDVASGQTIWSMGQSGLMNAPERKDYLLFATTTRLPSDPIHAIARSLGADSGVLIQNWLVGAPPKESTINRIDNAISDTIFPDNNKLPAARPVLEDSNNYE